MAKGVPVVTVDGSLAQKVELQNVRTTTPPPERARTQYPGHRLR